MDGNDEVDAGTGVDWVSGGEGDDVLDGFTENDTLYGDADEDTLNGHDGNDTLRGGGDNDVLNGEDDDDDLRCGGGLSDDANGGSHVNGDAFLGAQPNGGCEVVHRREPVVPDQRRWAGPRRSRPPSRRSYGSIRGSRSDSSFHGAEIWRSCARSRE